MDCSLGNLHESAVHLHYSYVCVCMYVCIDTQTHTHIFTLYELPIQVSYMN